VLATAAAAAFSDRAAALLGVFAGAADSADRGGDVTSSSCGPPWPLGEVTTVQGVDPLEPSDAVDVSTSECSSLPCKGYIQHLH
jgi:hypothetical protein